MEQELLDRLSSQDQKLEQIFISVEKTRKYFLWTLIITFVTFVLPLIGLVFAIPFFLSTFSGVMGGL